MFYIPFFLIIIFFYILNFTQHLLISLFFFLIILIIISINFIFLYLSYFSLPFSWSGMWKLLLFFIFRIITLLATIISCIAFIIITLIHSLITQKKKKWNKVMKRRLCNWENYCREKLEWRISTSKLQTCIYIRV